MRKITKIEPKTVQIRRKKQVAAYARVSIDTDRLRHSISAQISWYSTLIQKKYGMGVCRSLCRLCDQRNKCRKTE